MIRKQNLKVTWLVVNGRARTLMLVQLLLISSFNYLIQAAKLLTFPMVCSPSPVFSTQPLYVFPGKYPALALFWLTLCPAIALTCHVVSLASVYLWASCTSLKLASCYVFRLSSSGLSVLLSLVLTVCHQGLSPISLLLRSRY